MTDDSGHIYAWNLVLRLLGLIVEFLGAVSKRICQLGEGVGAWSFELG